MHAEPKNESSKVTDDKAAVNRQESTNDTAPWDVLNIIAGLRVKN
jgi:hypothetical protein